MLTERFRGSGTYACLRKRERKGGGRGGGTANMRVLCKNKRNVFVFLNLQEYYVTRSIIYITERNRVV